MASLDEIRDGRLKKLALLRDKGIDPYPAKTTIDSRIVDALSGFEKISAGGREVTIGGRIMSLRSQGALIFFDIFDGTGRMQALLKKNEDGNEKNQFDLFVDTIDIGDFVEVKGTLFVTKRGQQTIDVQDWRILSKSLLPLPEKWAGLQDVEERLRHRYLDFLGNAEARDIVEKKSKFWKSVRDFLNTEGFLEVETPVLETTTGGADARPFKTHHNALDIDVYLRISAGELWQKELMVAGFPKTFEIGRIFRNEGMSAEHAQDYTQMEFYWAYADFEKGMNLVERLYKHVAMETFGTLQFTIGEHEVDLSKKWEQYDYAETIKKYTDIDISYAEISDIEEKLNDLKVGYDKKGWNKSRAIDSLWKHVRKQLSGPGFVIGVPKEVSPLAKTDEKNPLATQRFQPIIAGSELGNGYSELNDPIDQAERFKAQSALREAGDDEAQMFAHDFVEALEYGMPPTCGFGMSERLFAFLANKPIRETQLFPLLRPKE
jgi:lysyl-tRNA synthetase class 2